MRVPTMASLMAVSALVLIVAAAPATAGAASQGKASVASKKKNPCLKKKRSSWRIRCLVRRQDRLLRRIQKLDKKKSVRAVGATGPVGPPGPRGPKGDTGAQGPKGDPFDGPIFHRGKIVEATNSDPSKKISATSECPGINQAAIGGWGYSPTGLNMLVGYERDLGSPAPTPDSMGDFLVQGYGPRVVSWPICVNRSLVDWSPFAQP